MMRFATVGIGTGNIGIGFFMLQPLHNVLLFVKLSTSTRQVLPKRRGAPAFGLGLLHFVDAR